MKKRMLTGIMLSTLCVSSAMMAMGKKAVQKPQIIRTSSGPLKTEYNRTAGTMQMKIDGVTTVVCNAGVFAPPQGQQVATYRNPAYKPPVPGTPALMGGPQEYCKVYATATVPRTYPIGQPHKLSYGLLPDPGKKLPPVVPGLGQPRPAR